MALLAGQRQLPVQQAGQPPGVRQAGAAGDARVGCPRGSGRAGVGQVVEEVGAYLGVATNNVAEWTALVLGLEAAAKRGIERLAVRLDSELVVKQLRGEYRVKHAGLQPLYDRARQLLRRFTEVEVRHVPRAENVLADRLVNRLLDQEARTPAK